MLTQSVRTLGSETRDNESEMEFQFLANEGWLGKKKNLKEVCVYVCSVMADSL